MFSNNKMHYFFKNKNLDVGNRNKGIYLIPNYIKCYKCRISKCFPKK